jgi:hypothetical protein
MRLDQGPFRPLLEDRARTPAGPDQETERNAGHAKDEEIGYCGTRARSRKLKKFSLKENILFSKKEQKNEHNCTAGSEHIRKRNRRQFCMA